MKARLMIIAAAGVLLGALALAPPADAGHLDWSFGVGFHVGGLHFRVGFSPQGYGGYPGPFFLTTNRLHYPGYSCNGACFRRGAGYYHHSSCPLLSFHFRGGGYGPDYYINNYAPYRGYGQSYGRYYPNRSYRNYYRDGYRDRYRPQRGRHYQGDRHHRDRYDRDRRHKGYRDNRGSRQDRGRGHDYDRDRSRDRRRSYRDDRGGRGRGGERDRAKPRRGAHRTRPPG
jgi:hypothetical protein